MHTNEKLMLTSPYVAPHQIMNIVNTAWAKSFARVESNKKAISGRGLLTYNPNILLYPCICASMTTLEKEK